jgi:hypothetical protein
MLNEPGIAAEFGPSAFTFANNTNNQRVDSVTIYVPAAGKVIAEANGYVLVDHTNGTIDNIGLQVFTNPNDYVFTYGCSRIFVPSVLPTATDYNYNFGCKNIFDVNSATTLKIYLIVRQFNGASISGSNVMYSSIIATYYPTAYGNTPVVLSNIPQAGVEDGSRDSNPDINVIYKTAEESNAKATDELINTQKDNDQGQNQENGSKPPSDNQN